jgi:hypothetical protein
VLIQLKDPSRSRELLEDCNRLIPGIPAVLAYTSGTPLPMDRPNIVSDYSVGFFVAFKDDEGYRAYTDHPSHLALVEKWRSAWKDIRIVDFLDGSIQPAGAATSTQAAPGGAAPTAGSPPATGAGSATAQPATAQPAQAQPAQAPTTSAPPRPASTPAGTPPKAATPPATPPGSSSQPSAPPAAPQPAQGAPPAPSAPRGS